MDLDEVWRIRENEVYPALFGPLSRGIFPLDRELFAAMGRPDPDPRWLFMGVLEYAPTSQRKSWLYVTSGYSNPWHVEPEDYDPEGESGAGVEFTLESAARGDWAILALQRMLAFQLLLESGQFPGKEFIGLHDRMPLRGPIDGRADCQIRNLFLAEPEGIASDFKLPSGGVLLMAFGGASDPEIEFAKQNGTPALIDRLRAASAHPAIDPLRASII